MEEISTFRHTVVSEHIATREAHLRCSHNFVSKKGQLSIVDYVMMYDAQLTRNLYTNQLSAGQCGKSM